MSTTGAVGPQGLSCAHGAHEWLSETQYRFRRCKHCGAHPFEDAFARLRRSVHVHVGDGSGNAQPHGGCYGRYETCGEHHMHDARCGSRDLICGRSDDEDSIVIVEWIEARLKEESKDVAERTS